MFSKQAFTLVEVMVAVAVLSFGILSLYQAFFISVDAAQMALDRLAVQEWAERKIWEEEDAYRKTHQIDFSYQTGTFKVGIREFSWVKGIKPIERVKNESDFAMEFVDQNMKSLVLNITWRAGGHERGMIFGDALSF
jgi:prepilin-type N-terminal cleavage/methylation domain-containing protein